MKKSTADDIIEYLQSIYSVLLKSAALISFAVLLFVILIVTTFLALNPRSIFLMLVRDQEVASNLIYFSLRRSKNGNWKSFARNSSGLNREILHEDTRTASNAFLILAFICGSLIALPANDVAYGFNLFRPVRAAKLPWYVEAHFSYSKLVGDLVRLLLLLPMWMVLTLPYWVVLGVITLFRAIRERVWLLRDVERACAG